MSDGPVDPEGFSPGAKETGRSQELPESKRSRWGVRRPASIPPFPDDTSGRLRSVRRLLSGHSRRGGESATELSNERQRNTKRRLTAYQIEEAHRELWGDDPAAVRRRTEYEESGCVVMAAEVAFGALATDEEIDQRLSDTERHTQRINTEFMQKIIPYTVTTEDAFSITEDQFQEEDRQQLEAYYKEKARQQVEDYYKELGRHDTPLGREIGKYSVSRRQLSAAEIAQANKNGNIVFMENSVQEEYDISVDHIVQIGLYPPTAFDSEEILGNFTDSSDVSGLYDNPEGPFYCYVFSK
jgi:hypothetical protein